MRVVPAVRPRDSGSGRSDGIGRHAGIGDDDGIASVRRHTMKLSTRFSKTLRPYTGKELRPHFLLTEMGLRGSALGAFVGPCDVKTEQLVDWEDRLKNDSIQAKEMLHVIGEFFGASLREGVLLQRLWVAVLGDQVREILLRGRSGGGDGEDPAVRRIHREQYDRLLQEGPERDGDDLFFGERKLTVSIVTASPVSQLFHLGINLDPEGAPVSAIGLYEMGLERGDIPRWGQSLLDAFSQEVDGMEWACAKVRPVF